MTQLAGVGGCILSIIVSALIPNFLTNHWAEIICGVLLGRSSGCGVWAMVDAILLACRAFIDGEGKPDKLPGTSGSRCIAVWRCSRGWDSKPGHPAAVVECWRRYWRWQRPMSSFAPVGTMAVENKMIYHVAPGGGVDGGRVGWKLLSALTGLISFDHVFYDGHGMDAQFFE